MMMQQFIDQAAGASVGSLRALLWSLKGLDLEDEACREKVRDAIRGALEDTARITQLRQEHEIRRSRAAGKAVISCPQCLRQYAVEPSLAGKLGQCGKCQARFAISIGTPGAGGEAVVFDE